MLSAARLHYAALLESIAYRELTRALYGRCSSKNIKYSMQALMSSRGECARRMRNEICRSEVANDFRRYHGENRLASCREAS